MENNDKRNNSPCISKPASGVVVTPFDVIQKAEYYEPINERLTNLEEEKEKSGFWHSIFGEKKCKDCSQKKSKCSCKVTKKKNIEGKFRAKVFSREENIIPSGKNQYTHGKETIQKSASPVGIGLPIARRGCGCQFYFCIDGKQGRLKSKNAINQDNEKVKSNTQKGFSNLMESNVTACSEGPKVTIVCETPTNRADESGSNFNLNNKASILKTDHAPTKNKIEENEPETRRTPTVIFPIFQEQIAISYQLQGNTNGKYFADNANKEKLKNSRANDTLESQERSFDESGLSPFNENHKKRPTLQKENKNKEFEFEEKQGGIFRNQDRAEVKKEKIISQTRSDLKLFWTQDSSSNITEQIFEGKKKDYDDEEAVTGEFETNNRRRKSRGSYRKNSLFLKNSLISFSRQRRKSQLESRVSQIFTKLISIDRKLLDLEQKCIVKNEDNITMGISCSNKKSTISIKFNKEKEKDGKNKTNMETNTRNNNPEFYRILSTNSNHEVINVTPPQEININHQEKSKTEHVVHHNLHELDAHRISFRPQSNTGNFKCVNPKIIIEYPPNSVLCDKWRRVSEELKISKPNVTTNRL